MPMDHIFNMINKDDDNKYRPSKAASGFSLVYEQANEYLSTLTIQELQENYTRGKELGKGGYGSVFLADMRYCKLLDQS